MPGQKEVDTLVNIRTAARPALAGLLLILFIISIVPAPAHAAEPGIHQCLVLLSSPPIIDDDPPETTTPATTQTSTDQQHDESQAPAAQQGEQGAARPPVAVFLLIIFVLGVMAGYTVRGMVEKRRSRDEDGELSADEIEQAYSKVDEEYYGKEPEPTHNKTILAVSQPKRKDAVDLAEDDLAVDDETYVLPQGKARRLSEALEPADVDFYNRPYYYDEDGMPYYHDPNTGEPVYYHELAGEELGEAN